MSEKTKEQMAREWVEDNMPLLADQSEQQQAFLAGHASRDAEVAGLYRDLHQVRAEWHEEKKRVIELDAKFIEWANERKEMRHTIEHLKRQLSEAIRERNEEREVVDFYADRYSWQPPTAELINKNNRCAIRFKDRDIANSVVSGGGRARAQLQPKPRGYHIASCRHCGLESYPHDPCCEKSPHSPAYQPKPSKSDEEAFESWVIDQRWFQPDAETDMIARDSWLAASAPLLARIAELEAETLSLAASLEAFAKIHQAKVDWDLFPLAYKLAAKKRDA